MPEGNFLSSLLPLIFVVFIFYFLVIRPQQKSQKQHLAMINDLKKGDTILTSGGLFCEVVKPEDDFIKVKLNDDVVVKLAREFVSKKIEVKQTDEK